jgi:tRNA modification GTPase
MKYRENNETIVALATGRGNSALAIIRISGRNSFEIISKCIFPSEKFIHASPKNIHLFKIIDNEKKQTIDEITAIKYQNPESYTGEDMVEIICHGSEIVIEEILLLLLKKGIRLAEKGEFTRRAYLNGKMDLLKAESIHQIITSSNKWNFKNALGMYSGESKRKLLGWKKEIVAILTEIEARIEFPEEDDLDGKRVEYKKNIEFLSKKIEKEIIKRQKINIINSGFTIPIVGIANAGKSSLFNLIMGFDRTIVHHEEGTTRDAISEEIKIKDEKVKIIDTAGLNETKNPIELIGIEKSWEYIKKGNLIVLVTPADNEINENENRILTEIKNEKIIVVISKKDIKNSGKKKVDIKKFDIPYIEVCLINDKERNEIIDFIGLHIEKAIKEQDEECGIICNKRQEEIIIRINNRVKSIMEKIDFNFEEIISYELKEILDDLGAFVGETSNEEILNSIFSEFCIGK